MTVLSKQDLSTGSAEVWADWLQHALLTYGRIAEVSERMSAFAPLDIDSATQSPAGEIVSQIRRISSGSEPAMAALEVLRTWSPPLDGTPGAVLLIQIANRLGARGLAPAILRLLGRAEELPAADQDEIAFLAIEAAADRFKRTEVAELAAMMWRRNLITPARAADFAMLMAQDHLFGLGGLPQALVLLFPNIAGESAEPEYIEAIGNRLLIAYPPETLGYAFGDQDDEKAPERHPPDPGGAGSLERQIDRFRKELLRQVAPWFDGGLMAEFITPETEREVDTWVQRAGEQPDSQPPPGGPPTDGEFP